jgi:hypothetical protein
MGFSKPCQCWAGEEAGDERISGELAFHFNGVRVWITPKQRAAVENLFKQAMQLPELQTTLTELELQYGEV